MVEEWNGLLDEWKKGKFADIDVNTIENAAAGFQKRITKVQKDLKADATPGIPPWKVLDTLKENVDGMKKLMPLIMDLRNEAMRDRHWNQLMDDVGKTFDQNAPDFTLEKVLALGLEHHSDSISTISTAAGKASSAAARRARRFVRASPW